MTDTGPGIAPEDQEGLFTAFQRTRRSVAEGQEGTGLGLHISQKLASLLHAQIQLESRPGEGSTFSVVLPP